MRWCTPALIVTALFTGTLFMLRYSPADPGPIEVDHE